MSHRSQRRFVTYGTIAVALVVPFVFSAWHGREASRVVWSFQTEQPFFSAPAIDAERIYFVSADQQLHGLDWQSREVLWTLGLPETPRATPVYDESSGDLFLSTRSGVLMCIDALQGTVRWQLHIPGLRFRGGPTVSGDTLYLGCQNRWLYAIAVDDGSLRWKRFMEGPILRPVAVDAERVYVTTYKGHLIAIDRVKAEEVWRFVVPDSVMSWPQVDGDLVLFGSHDKHLYAVDAATGEERWRHRTWHEVTTRPAVMGNRVVFGSWDHHLICVDRDTGRLRWRHFMRDVIESSPLIAGGTVYAGSWAGAVDAVDLETGHLRWTQQTGTWVTAPPVLAPDGRTVLAASEDGTLYAFAP